MRPEKLVVSSLLGEDGGKPIQKQYHYQLCLPVDRRDTPCMPFSEINISTVLTYAGFKRDPSIMLSFSRVRTVNPNFNRSNQL